MEETIIKGLMDKVGIDRTQAEQVIQFLRDNSDKIPALLGGVKDKLPGGLGKLF